MRPPTGNLITQRKHGKYNAVDYDDAPDVYVYAPERMTFTAYYPLAGDAGNNLQMTGANGRHGFCHLEEIYVAKGQTVEKSARIAKMGYTGLTIPKGLPGRHLHWVLYRNGVYVYPPDYITEPFNTPQGGTGMDGKFKNDEEIQEAYFALRGKRATDQEVEGHRNSTWRQFFTNKYAIAEINNRTAEVTELKGNVNRLNSENKTLRDQLQDRAPVVDPALAEKARKYDLIIEGLK